MGQTSNRHVLNLARIPLLSVESLDHSLAKELERIKRLVRTANHKVVSINYKFLPVLSSKLQYSVFMVKIMRTRNVIAAI